jgi:sulfofructose kinase
LVKKSMTLPFEIARNRKFDVITFGTNAVDHLLTVPHYPRFDSKVELVDARVLPGGEAASTAVGLARLGLRTSYVGSFGDDHEGEIGLHSLTAEGVDISYSRVVAGARTQIAYIVVDARNGERTIVWKRDERLSFSIDEVPISIAADCGVLHLTPHDLDAAIHFATAARASGTIVSIDADRTQDGLNELLSLVDVCILSASLLTELSAEKNTADSLKDVANTFECAVVGVTLGDRGSLVFDGRDFFAHDAYSVPGGCVDTTGAGDAYRCGFIYGLISDGSIEKASQYANAVAALKCRDPGARNALPNADELTLFCK